MAYGFFESYENAQRTLFHGGGIHGFMAGLYLVPARRMGFFIADNGYNAGLVWKVAHDLLDHYFPNPGVLPVPPAGFARRAGLFTGTYRLMSHSHGNLEKAGALRGGEVQVIDREDGTLEIFGDRFVEVGPLLFQNTQTEERLAFGRDRQGRIRYLFTQDLFTGNDSLERVPWYETGGFSPRPRPPGPGGPLLAPGLVVAFVARLLLARHPGSPGLRGLPRRVEPPGVPVLDIEVSRSSAPAR